MSHIGEQVVLSAVFRFEKHVGVIDLEAIEHLV